MSKPNPSTNNAMANTKWVWGSVVTLIAILFGAILYMQDWTALRPWTMTPIRDATIGDAFVFLVIYLVARK